MRRLLKPLKPLQRLIDLLLLETGSTEFATQMLNLGAGVTAPVVFVHVDEHIEHDPQY
ncbi:MAG: hypothetical protein RJA29_2198, partial [Pseudomonadota bacterium]